MRIISSRSGTRRRALRGVAFIYFALLVIPLFLFGAGMASDFTLVVTANRQVADAARSAALAGAQQFVPNTAAVDASAAPSAAAQTFCAAKTAGALTLVAPASGGTRYACPAGGPVYLKVTLGSAASYAGTNGFTSVAVTAYYSVPRLTFAALFGGSSSTKTLSVTRTASVCLPGRTSGVLSGGTNGFCARP